MPTAESMCGRFVIYRSIHVIAEFLAAPEPTFDFGPRYNLAPTQTALACRLEAQQRDRELVRLKWGLIPSWAKDESAGAMAINARAETLTEKPFFRAAFKRRRCLIPADGFYEWRKTGSKSKQPYFIHPAQSDLFAFAGLWESWDKGEEPVESCTIITTTANDATRELHERMPVILSQDTFPDWLDPSTPQAELLDLLRPCPDDWIALHRVDKRVGNVKYDDPALIEPQMDAA